LRSATQRERERERQRAGKSSVARRECSSGNETNLTSNSKRQRAERNLEAKRRRSNGNSTRIALRSESRQSVTHNSTHIHIKRGQGSFTGTVRLWEGERFLGALARRLLYLISALSMAGIQSARFVQVGLTRGRVQASVAALTEISDLFFGGVLVSAPPYRVSKTVENTRARVKRGSRKE